MTLMPVSNDLDLGRLVGELGRRAVDGQRLLGVDRAALVDRLADDVEDAAEAPRGRPAS